jgi:flagellar motor switch protein FliN/FliY
VTETIEYEQFEQGADGSAPAADGVADGDLSRLSEIPMELSVEIGRTHMTVGETLDLRVGSVVALERLAGETADLLVNGTAIARGEVVVIDEQYGLRITVILDGHAELELGESGGSEAPGASDVAPDAPEPVDAPAAEAPASDEQPTDAAEGDGG